MTNEQILQILQNTQAEIWRQPTGSFLYWLWKTAGSDEAYDTCWKFIAESNPEREISIQRIGEAIQRAQAVSK